jgi:hypothetical protein
MYNAHVTAILQYSLSVRKKYIQVSLWDETDGCVTKIRIVYYYYTYYIILYSSMFLEKLNVNRED